jgi:lipoprotein-anchoring transpeptidase ErfK/SrfK
VRNVLVRWFAGVVACLMLAGTLAGCAASRSSAGGSSLLPTTSAPTTRGTPTTATPTTSPTGEPSASPSVVPSASAVPSSSVEPHASAAPTASPAPSVEPTTSPVPTTEPAPSPTGPSASPSPTAPPEPETLDFGSEGWQVERMQRRLASMGYFVPDIDGIFGEDTEHAVMAFQKANRIGVDGVVGPQTREALQKPVALKPQENGPGRHVEVDISRQILMFVWNGRVTRVFDTSTGNGETFENESGSLVEARTPLGAFTVQRKIDGLRVSYLGELWRPAYFYGGYAIHGSPSVPPYPASHGCVRLTNKAMDWAYDRLPVGTPVYVYNS